MAMEQFTVGQKGKMFDGGQAGTILEIDENRCVGVGVYDLRPYKVQFDHDDVRLCYLSDIKPA